MMPEIIRIGQATQVAVPSDRDAESVRSFPTSTRDLNALADWLQQCGVQSVAMESTSVYWISGLPDPGGTRVRSLPCQRAAREECPGKENGRF
jgi:hypothetical protein